MFDIKDILFESHDNSCDVLTSDLVYRFGDFNLGFTLIINGQEFGHYMNCDFAVVYSNYGDTYGNYEEADFYVCKGTDIICSFNTIFDFNHLTYNIVVDDDRYNSYIVKVETELWNQYE